MQAKRLGGFLTVVVAILAVGVGYAAFTSQVTLNGNASAGTLSIQWIGPAYPAVTTTDPNLTCNVTLTPSVVTMTVGGLYPGASCTMPLSDKVVVKNVGTLPAAIAGVYAAGGHRPEQPMHLRQLLCRQLRVQPHPQLGVVVPVVPDHRSRELGWQRLPG